MVGQPSRLSGSEYRSFERLGETVKKGWKTRFRTLKSRGNPCIRSIIGLRIGPHFRTDEAGGRSVMEDQASEIAVAVVDDFQERSKQRDMLPCLSVGRSG